MTFNSTLVKRFKFIAEQFSSNPAINDAYGQLISYSTLDEWSEKTANALSLHIPAGQRIAIFNDKSVVAFSLMIACLKAGIGYINLDLKNPIHRLKSMLTQSDVCCLYWNDKFHAPHELTEFLADKNIGFNSFSEISSNHCKIEKKTTISNLAYIVFTSGSTGEPKGAMITHNNLIPFIDWIRAYFEISDKDRFSNLNPMHFDNSVFDFYGALFNGACLNAFDEDTVSNPAKLISALCEKQCTIWFSVPTLLNYLLITKSLTREIVDKFRYFVFGGEGFQKSQLFKLFSLCSSNTKLVNVYGPTEATCICSAHTISNNDFIQMSGLPPLGIINPYFEYSIKHQNSSEIGELIIAGSAVGNGYINSTQLTEDSFKIENNVRSYATGDLVSLDSNGLLHFHGRADNQIKHLGHRIELEEIEAIISQINGIESIITVYKPIDPVGGEIIASICVNNFYDETIYHSEVERLLPAYMRPNKTILMTSLPINRNGKLSRKILLEQIS